MGGNGEQYASSPARAVSCLTQSPAKSSHQNATCPRLHSAAQNARPLGLTKHIESELCHLCLANLTPVVGDGQAAERQDDVKISTLAPTIRSPAYHRWSGAPRSRLPGLVADPHGGGSVARLMGRNAPISSGHDGWRPRSDPDGQVDSPAADALPKTEVVPVPDV